MSSLNLPTVSAKIVGDSTGLVDALKKAEVQTNLSTAKMSASVDQAMTRIEHRFSLAHLSTEVLKGIGIGGGFALAEKAADLIAEHWKAAAEAAKSVEESSQKQLDATLELIKARQTDDQHTAQLQIDRQRIVEKMAALSKAPTPMKSVPTGNMAGGMMGVPTFQNIIDQDAVDKNVKAGNELGAALAKIDAELAKIGTKKSISDLSETLKIAAIEGRNYANIKEITADDEARAAKLTRDLDEELDKQADKYRELGDPLRKYRDALKEINDLEERGKLTGMEAAQARAGNLEKNGLLTPNRAMMDEASMAGTDAQIDKTLEKTSQISDAAKELGISFSSAFEDAIVGGKSLGDVLRGLEQDIIRIALRKAVIEPLVSSFVGLFTGGHAGGGDVGQGTTTLVGENGPELFTPNVSGSIIPNNALRAGGGAGGGTYYIDARGADRTGLARLEAMIRAVQGQIKPTSLAAVTDSRRRVAA